MEQSTITKDGSLDTFVATGVMTDGSIKAKEYKDVLGVYYNSILLFKVTPKDIRGNIETTKDIAPILAYLANREGLELKLTNLKLSKMTQGRLVRAWRWKKPTMIDDTSLLDSKIRTVQNNPSIYARSGLNRMVEEFQRIDYSNIPDVMVAPNPEWSVTYQTTVRTDG